MTADQHSVEGLETQEFESPRGALALHRLTLLTLANLVLRHRILVVGVALGLGFSVAAVLLTQERSYTSSASFTPQSRRPVSNLSGIAAQFGLTLPGTESNQLPAFYVDLLQSRAILGAVVDSAYSFPTSTGEQRETLTLIFRIRGPDPAWNREQAIRRLRESIATSLVLKTAVITVSVRTRYPILSTQVAQRLLAELNRFNLETRQSQAAQERRFVEKRLAEVRGDLRQSEDRLQEFLIRNRDYRNSPVLVFEEDRLARDVALGQQLYTMLAGSYEQAKIEEVRDTPVVTVVEPPNVPVRPDSRRVATRTLIALLIGTLLGTASAYVADVVRGASAERDAEFGQFVTLGKDAFLDLRHPIRAIRRSVAAR